jgi:hypothetical protein
MALQDFDFEATPRYNVTNGIPPLPNRRRSYPPLHPLVTLCCVVYLVMTALSLLAALASMFQFHHAIGAIGGP